jgi:hypothetical protein
MLQAAKDYCVRLCTHPLVSEWKIYQSNTAHPHVHVFVASIPSRVIGEETGTAPLQLVFQKDETNPALKYTRQTCNVVFWEDGPIVRHERKGEFDLGSQLFYAMLEKDADPL